MNAGLKRNAEAIQVLYEASCFSAGWGEPLVRTGIFRVAENVALGLAASGWCELTFCVLGDFHHCESARRYLASVPQFSDRPLSLNRAAEMVSQREARLRQKIARTGRRTLVNKVSLEATRFFRRQIARWGGPLKTSHLREAEVLHLPFHVFAPRQWINPRLIEFQMIHDLIPVLFPEYFADKGGGRFLLKKLAALRPNQWFFANSISTKNDLCRVAPKLNPEKVIVTPLAAASHFRPCADAERIHLTLRKYHIPPAPYFLSVATLEPRKNLTRTIKCFARLVQEQRLPDLHLVLVGRKGWLYDGIFQQVAQVPGLAERIIFTDFVADEDLPAIYSRAVGFIYISLYEGFGLPVLEAMQCGTPVITANNSSLPEVAGDAAILIEATDEDGLCQAMDRLYHDATLRDALRLKGLRRAQQFSWERTAEATIAGYRKALEKAR